MVKQHPNVQAEIPTQFGRFLMQTFPDSDSTCHLLLTYGNVDVTERILARIHSKCLTGEVFGSLRCDCQPQLLESMRLISEHGSGLIIYLDQEGRGIGLVNKIRAYALQDGKGLDTVDANLAVGQPVDDRRYDIAVEILQSLKANRIALMTNNPDKVQALIDAGFDVERRPLEISANDYNVDYLETKRERLDHMLSMKSSNNFHSVTKAENGHRQS
ncbi:GTP cyclohydrolase II [Chloroflexi bacterium TSY]|nr:GTP cyclohydrolase II [Chloroflexi bacterium TSY]